MPGELRVVNEGLAHASPIKIEVANHQGIPVDLHALGYNHIGDIDVLDGVIYGSLESGSKEDGSYLISWNATDLTLIRYVHNTMWGMPWVAIEPTTRELYSAVWGDCCLLQIYDSTSFEFKRTLRVGNDTNPMPSEIQGAAFYEGDLYLSCNGNDTIWKVDVATGTYEYVLSDLMAHHEYEMEGLDFWDLRHRGLGVMHMYGNFMKVVEKSIRSYEP
eukprot:gene23586-29815_t